MTATTNGASLEDCLTNIFSLIDLNGIRWKRFKQKESSDFLVTSIDTHPVLTTYAKCIEENHIAVWRNEPQRKHNQPVGSGPGGGTGSTGHSNFPTPSRTSNNNTPTSAGPNTANLGSTTGATNTSGNQNFNSTNSNNLELWIFGYSNNFKVDDVVGSDLVEIEDDSWEQKGLSYECRSLLFKALHNLIDRCLIIKGFTRIGCWFVQPSTHDHSACCHNNQNNSNKRSLKHLKTHQTSSINPLQSPKSSINLSATVSSAIYNFIDGKQEIYDTRQCLDKVDELRHTSSRSSSSYFTSSLDRTKSSLSFAFSFFVHGDSTICAAVDVRQHPLIHPITRSDLTTVQAGGIVRVALAPYGLNGILNGVNYKDSDNGAATTTFVQHWSKYYPLPKTMSRLVPLNRFNQSNSAMATNFNQKPQTSTTNQFNQGNSETPGSRSCLSNLTNMLLPPTAKATLQFNHEPHEVPPVVEVIVAGHRMRYPSECVFTTSKVVDLYKSVEHLESPPKSNPTSIKRPVRTSPPKPNKLSLLSEILSEDKNTGPGAKEKSNLELSQNQSKFDNPFTLPSSVISASPGLKHGLELNDPSQRPNSTGTNKESESGPNSNTSAQTTTSRYNSSVSSYNSSYNTLMSSDIVKLFPTPPSLEQMIVSPSTTIDESLAMKDLVPPSPATNLDALRDCGIDVYKPVECAVMPPPPKWAALSNIVITSSDRLPPQFIYKGSSQKTNGKNDVTSRSTTESIHWNNINPPNSVLHQTKQLSALQYKSDSSLNSPGTPLTDQTNKKGFNMNPTTPKSILSNTMLNSPAAGTTSMFSPIITTLSTTNAVMPLPAYTLPHQRLFNNLTEINSIQLNLLISDSQLGMFLDHNFENCTLCVCNMSIKGSAPDVIPQKAEMQTPWRNPMAVDTTGGQTLTGINEYSNECTCGFSAITNRHYSHLTGLFFEDELEITNVLYDPIEMIDQNKLFRKIRLASYTEETLNEEQKIIARMVNSENAKSGIKGQDEAPKATGIKQEKVIKEEKSSHHDNLLEETKLFVLGQLKQQCSTMIHSNSSLAKVLMIEAFRNNRHLTSCINYYAQATPRTQLNPFSKLTDDANKYTQVKMINRNPCSLKFSDFCELTKGIITKLGMQHQHQNTRMTGGPIKTHPGQGTNNLTHFLSKMFSPARQSLIGKPIDPHASSRNNIFSQGLQALVLPTLTTDPKGALKMLEQLVKDESKDALATLNKAILIFSSPIHDWQYLTTPIPENNFDVVNVLRLLQPSIEEAVGSHNKSYKDFKHQEQQHIFSARDSPTCEPVKPTPPCQGPLTWRQFHQTSGRGTDDQCEPQPIPSLLTSYHVDRSHIAVSPFALKFWDKLLLEPYAPGHSVFYLVLAPDNPNITGHIKSYFEELSNTYELMKMGKHIPIGKGIVLARDKVTAESTTTTKDNDDWFSLLDFDHVDPLTGNIIALLKSYARQLDSDLVKTIAEFIDLHQPTYDPHSDRFESSPNPHEVTRVSKPIRLQHPPFSGPFSNALRGELNPDTSALSAMRQHPLTADQGAGSSSTVPNNDVQTFIDPNTGLQTTIKSQILINANNAHASSSENTYMEDEPNKQTGIVVYIIDPFSLPSLTQNQRSLAIIGLIKCYSMLFNQLPENLKRVTQLQLVSLDSIIGHSRPITELSRVDQLKSIAMNIYSQCRKVLTNQITAKSLTGFGPAAALETFFKTKNPEICVTKMFTPPFILAPLKDKQTELVEMFGDRREKSSVIFCSYCITEDQRWLLVSVTNDKGEMSESTVINMNVPDRLRRPKASVRRVALKRLMDFIVSIMSEWASPWRLIIGKLGRVGHGELKEWATLMSKRSLLNYSRHLTERCRQCCVIPPGETVAILSACLVSLEPDSKLRVMPDQFANDDRQASFNKCPLSTPEDASVTHIFVFPTSASIQPTLGNVEDPLLGSGLDDDLLNQFPLEDGMEDLGVEENMDDLFSGAWDDQPTNVTHHDPLASSSHPQGMGSMSGGDNPDNQDETLQLLQQPLALGYYISTAKIGQMPNWFWSTSPHLRNSCPVFLKSALHIHLPCVQLSDDLLHSAQSKKGHSLDSNLTTEVLRYVLEGYNSLSWLALNARTFDRQSCLPVHMQNLLQLYHLVESFS